MKNIYNENNMNKFYDELNSLLDKYHVKMFAEYNESYDYDYNDEPIYLGGYPYIVFEDYDGNVVWKIIEDEIIHERMNGKVYYDMSIPSHREKNDANMIAGIVDRDDVRKAAGWDR